MDVIVAISTILVIIIAIGVMAYKHDREIRKSQKEINRKGGKYDD